MARKNYFHKKTNIEATPLTKRIIKSLVIWTLEITLAVGGAYLIAVNGFDKTKVSGNSMMPTLNDGTVLVVNKFAYAFKQPERGDVIVYKRSNKEHSYFEIKRVIGLPGETIIIKNGTAYVNDIPQKEVVNIIESTNGGLAEDGVTLDDNEYFVLGDNREESEDSRFASSGNVLKNEIIGEALAVEKPFMFVDSINRAER